MASILGIIIGERLIVRGDWCRVTVSKDLTSHLAVAPRAPPLESWSRKLIHRQAASKTSDGDAGDPHGGHRAMTQMHATSSDPKLQGRSDGCCRDVLPCLETIRDILIRLAYEKNMNK